MDDVTDLKFTGTHEWVRRKGSKIVVGITEYAQQRMSDITNVELPEPDDHHYEADEDMCVIESLRMATDCHAPVSGRIVAINTDLLAKPEIINSDPYGEGWLVEMAPDNADDIDSLMDSYEYEAGLPEEEEE